jgi:L-ascorbate metabolism protein UlaG (beta-lactamase superfamily)
LIDPFLTGNPKAPLKPGDIRDIDLILVTHEHGDHLGDTKQIALSTGATVVASYDLTVKLAEEEGGLNTIGLNIGGTYIHNDVRITQVHAMHVSSYGPPTGYIIQRENISLYHSGDTGVFGDMALFSKLYNINIALLPIGGFYTMDIPQAVEAVKLIKPRIAIPMHYNTFPVIETDPYVFKRIVEEETDTTVMVLKIGEEKEIIKA